MGVRGSNLPRLGDYNQAVVLDAIRRAPEGVSRVELGASTGLTAQTISNIVRRLVDAGWVVQGDRVANRRGKPRTLLHVDPTHRVAVGVHLDPATVTATLVDLTGAGHDLRTAATPADPTAAIDLIATLAAELLTDIPADRVLGIGVAAPGPVDIEAGRLHRPPQLPGWHEVSLRGDLHAATGLPVLLDKDVTAAVTGERWAHGSGEDFVYVYLGSGLAAGAVLGGEVWRGRTNNVGNVGEILITHRTTSSSPENSGKWHTTVLPHELARRGVEAGVVEPFGSGLGEAAHAFSQLCSRADADPAARAILGTAADDLAAGVAVLVNFLDVHTVVLGGPFWPELESHLLTRLRSEVQPLIVTHHAVTVQGSRLAAHGAALGAGALVLDHQLSPRPSGLLVE